MFPRPARDASSAANARRMMSSEAAPQTTEAPPR